MRVLVVGAGGVGGYLAGTLAKNGKDVVDLPLPLKNSPHIAFSYSGIKNAVRLAIESGKHKKEDIAASFQKKAIEHLTFMCNRVFKKYDIKRSSFKSSFFKKHSKSPGGS